jgi:aminopeptidase N
VPAGDVSPFFGNNGVAEPGKSVTLKRYRVRLPAAGEKGRLLSLSYEGIVNDPLSDPREQYTRGFRETSGLLGPEGIYLAGSTFWVPIVDGGLLSFSLTVPAPAGWHLVSQGNGTSRDEKGAARWDSAGAVDEVYLVGGPLQRYADTAGKVEALAFLREKDDALAGKYLAATKQYVGMYQALIGAYPYGKFALVENFWETGYGMASFTLLGPQVIRFPFILNSSYPHEILHNWWGNSVFVDYQKGNWCEGLTAYLADHLIQEQRGRGDEYRRATLQKYRDYVKEGRDFPLTEFRSRHSAATEAVGYGKALMGFHGLRRSLGDDLFRKTLRRFYQDNRGKKATFDDFRKAAEAVSGKDLRPLFDPWVTRPGAAELSLSPVTVRPDGPAWVVEGTIRQVQAAAPFRLSVPIAVQTAKGSVVEEVLLEGREGRFSIRTSERPVALAADPLFDLFRRLDPRETPPSLGQIFGDPKVLALLPSSAPAAEQAAYRQLALSWKSDSHAVEVKLDSDVAALPADRAVWLFGKENRHAAAAFASRAAIAGGELKVDGETMSVAGHSAVIVVRNPASAEKAVGWLFAEPDAAFAGLGRKLPHYGKYSYLGFEGTEPVNVLKGSWKESDSPLLLDLRPAAERRGALPAVVLPARKALAELPPVFSVERMREIAAFLAAPEREGRGPGSAGLAAAADRLEKELKAIGLQPGGDAGTYRQRFTLEKGPDGKPVELLNVIGVLPGTKPEWKEQAVLVGAHYDHLGLGWPDSHAGDAGKVHPGADDNASGVAVVLELARAMAAGEKPQRSIVFALFSGEEAGLAGSKAYAARPPQFPLAGTIGVVNVDTVGRLGDRKVTVLGTATATEWPHIFRGAGFVTGVEGQYPPTGWEASDQATFIRLGRPAVQLFSGPHADYHRPSDTVDKLDFAGMAKVAAFAREAVAYLAERKEPMTVTIGPPQAAAPEAAGRPAAAGGAKRGSLGAVPALSFAGPRAGAAGARRVSLGRVPAFSFAAPGVKLDGTVPGSPAEKAGLVKGDVVLKIGTAAVADLRGLSEALKGLKAGDTVPVVYARDGKERTVDVTVAER